MEAMGTLGIEREDMNDSELARSLRAIQLGVQETLAMMLFVHDQHYAWASLSETEKNEWRTKAFDAMQRGILS